MRLQDAEYTRVLLVTLPETTPVSEAAALQADLRRAGIEPFAWIVNASLAAAAPRDPLLRRRAALEAASIARVQGGQAQGAVVPWLPSEPVGPSALLALAAGRAPARRAA